MLDKMLTTQPKFSSVLSDKFFPIRESFHFCEIKKHKNVVKTYVLKFCDKWGISTFKSYKIEVDSFGP